MLNSGTPHAPSWIAFDGTTRLAQGSPADVARAVQRHLRSQPDALPLVFDATSSARIELDWRTPLELLQAQLPEPPPARESEAPEPPRGPGRPRLGVTAREVTLLPRHWDWLAGQPGGASVALRKLVQLAMRESGDSDLLRERTEASYRFMSVMASSLPGFEEASRALFAADPERLQQLVAEWPQDVREHLLGLARR